MAQDYETSSGGNEETAAGNRDIYNGGYEISIEGGYIVEAADNGSILFSASYDNGKRVVKNGFETSSFVYDEEGSLTAEYRGENVINYSRGYDAENEIYRYESFSLNGEEYNYIWDDKCRIAGISDSAGNEIARYVYDGLECVDVLCYDEGRWISNVDAGFVGNVNRIRLYGEYWDVETGWYYSDGIYNDASANKIVGLYDNSRYLSDTNPYSVTTNEGGIMLLGYEDTDLEAEQWASQLLSDSSFNAARSKYYYTSSSTSTVEIIARLIYGENCARTLDQNAVAWIILNRYHYRNYDNKTIRDICIAPGDFLGINNPEAIKAHSSSDAYWGNAVYLACLMLTDHTEACWNATVRKPAGISNQVYFRSAEKLGVEIKENSDNQLYVSYNSGDVLIYKACVAGMGTAATIDGLRALMTEDESKYNIYFYHDN